ncbi:hypothetical protein TYRP_009283 [Tyrophagus putrescentiae]|nr:hypothetical protein TYRP_009283 [Tyrophagus putrescentiae]
MQSAKAAPVEAANHQQQQQQPPAPMTREALKSRIGALFAASIKAHPSYLTADQVERTVKHFLWEVVPAKVLQLNGDVSTGIYSRASLQNMANKTQQSPKATKVSKSLADSVPTFSSAAQVADHRRLYQRPLRPHVALDCETLLLPEGPVAGNAHLQQVTRLLMSEVDGAQEELLACSTTLHLLTPPLGGGGGEEAGKADRQLSSFELSLLSMAVGVVDSCRQGLSSCRSTLMAAHSQRAFDITALYGSPQLADMRQYVRHSEAASLENVALTALLLRNSLAALHQFVLQNGARLELILKKGLAGSATKYAAKEI